MNRPLNILNGKIVTAHKPITVVNVLTDGATILSVTDRERESPDAEIIDATGKYVMPGFIDIHVHGGAGHDFMDGTQESFLNVAELHARYGTTSMLPTSLSASREELLATLSAYESANKVNVKGSQFLGMHLEGPYFAMNQRGAQDPRYIRDPDPDEYKEILAAAPFIRRWSAAPELTGALEFGKYMTSHGVLAAAAHTDAIYEEVIVAFEQGFTLATHLYSGMSGVTRRNAFRYAGMIESAFIIDGMDVEIIADGIHLPAPLLKLIYKIKGPERIALITDAMRAAGMPPGKSRLGSLKNGLDVLVEDEVAKLADRSSFAGSVATADRLLRTMIKLAGVPLTEAVQMLTLTPARILDLANRKGSLEKGKDADIVIMNEDLTVHKTIIAGKVVYSENDKAV